MFKTIQIATRPTFNSTKTASLGKLNKTTTTTTVATKSVARLWQAACSLAQLCTLFAILQLASAASQKGAYDATIVVASDISHGFKAADYRQSQVASQLQDLKNLPPENADDLKVVGPFGEELSRRDESRQDNDNDDAARLIGSARLLDTMALNARLKLRHLHLPMPPPTTTVATVSITVTAPTTTTTTEPTTTRTSTTIGTSRMPSAAAAMSTKTTTTATAFDQTHVDSDADRAERILLAKRILIDSATQVGQLKQQSAAAAGKRRRSINASPAPANFDNARLLIGVSSKQLELLGAADDDSANKLHATKILLNNNNNNLLLLNSSLNPKFEQQNSSNLKSKQFTAPTPQQVSAAAAANDYDEMKAKARESKLSAYKSAAHWEQAMAVAMLPLVWPSLRFDAPRLQLVAASQLRDQRQLVDERNNQKQPTVAAVAAATVPHVKLAAPMPPPPAIPSQKTQTQAASTARPKVRSKQADYKSSNKRRKLRRKRKKSVHKDQLNSDSTRLANSYKLPKLRVANSTAQVAQHNQNLASESSSAVGKATAQVPRALAALLAVTQRNGSLSPPPTTSVSKVVGGQIVASNNNSGAENVVLADVQRQLHLSDAAADAAAANIKLFHFNRKPDTRKLPFYKKPLNFSDTGELISTGDESDDIEGETQRAEALRLIRELPELAVSGKRRRRAKASQLDKLLAALDGQAGGGYERSPKGSHSSAAVDDAAADATDFEPSTFYETEARGGDVPLVPVLKPRDEPPLVVAPALLINSKLRNVNKTTDSALVIVPAPKMLANVTSAAHSSSQSSDSLASAVAVAAAASSKPLQRIRRKHSSTGLEAVWRPIEVASMHQQHQHQPQEPNHQHQRLLLVPSGMLTPSGSHLVPLFAQPALDERPHAFESVKSTVATAHGAQQQSPQAAAPIQQQQQQYSNRRSLLVKPLRPAKYSLNGYIPRPSLPLESPQHHHHHGNKSTAAAGKRRRQAQRRQAQQHTDLDQLAATSKETFAGRRGGLLQVSNVNTQDAGRKQRLPRASTGNSEQLEINKRRLMAGLELERARVDSDNKRNALSAQQVHEIRAKLSLISP